MHLSRKSWFTVMGWENLLPKHWFRRLDSFKPQQQQTTRNNNSAVSFTTFCKSLFWKIAGLRDYKVVVVAPTTIFGCSWKNSMRNQGEQLSFLDMSVAWTKNDALEFYWKSSHRWFFLEAPISSAMCREQSDALQRIRKDHWPDDCFMIIYSKCTFGIIPFYKIKIPEVIWSVISK